VSTPRRRASEQGIRRPRVAGLRNRTAEPVTTEDGTHDAVDERDGTAGRLDPPTRADADERPESPRPTGKRPSFGAALPAGWVMDTGAAPEKSTAESTEDISRDTSADTEAGARRGVGRLFAGLNLAIVLAVVAAVLAGLAVWFRTQANAAGAGVDNVALTDGVTTSEVVGQVRDAVNTLFSYGYTDLARTTEAAKGLLVGDAVREYDQLIQKFSQDIESQRLQVTVKTVNIGVVELVGDTARVLVFADQVAVRADAPPTGGPTQFAVNVRREDGRWKIVDFDFFDAAPPGN